MLPDRQKVMQTARKGDSVKPAAAPPASGSITYKWTSCKEVATPLYVSCVPLEFIQSSITCLTLGGLSAEFGFRGLRYRVWFCKAVFL